MGNSKNGWQSFKIPTCTALQSTKPAHYDQLSQGRTHGISYFNAVHLVQRPTVFFVKLGMSEVPAHIVQYSKAERSTKWFITQVKAE